MASQNSNMCADHTLASSVCPSYCGQCPLTCYSCVTNETDTRMTQCNTITCASDEICTVKRKRDKPLMNMAQNQCIQTRDISIKCCDQDLCNMPTTTTAATTLTTTASMSTPTSTIISTTTTPTKIKTGCIRDVIFMTDASLPAYRDVEKFRSCILEILQGLDIGNDLTRVAFAGFNIYGYAATTLDRGIDKSAAINFVTHTNFNPNVPQFSNNLAAVEAAVNMFHQGNRPQVPHVVIIYSVGNFHANHMDFLLSTGHLENGAIAALHKMSSDVIVVAMDNADISELRHIASDNGHIFYVGPNLPLHPVNQQILNLICS